ncbi:MFS general substrate transporter [Gonapodya prolifera JEL478]|uniref:MFS general substrate transporter n=1 Tax=Gonapodya prolifera (strain JEL478) TaxID=1344416 RepID=A0A139A1S7_GONPJ|nr:MFS general substrate transporter [Gonapodya prolifera JEL478]|eukprot:KXS10323.1 MFS general substrate transporter [Gonapodya prolifera JEL478]
MSKEDTSAEMALADDGKMTPINEKDWDPEVEKRLVRKLDILLVPFTSLMLLLAFIDRVNLANATVLQPNTPDSFNNSLGLVGNQFNWATAIFAAGMFVLDIPSNFMVKKFSARVWLSRIMVTWGIVVVAEAFVTNFTGIMVARFFLGVAEAGLLPGVVFYFSFWYLPEERAGRLAIFYSMQPFGGGWSGLLAIAIDHMNGVAGLKSWQWLFILEGIPAIILGVVAYFALLEFPHSPSTYLTEEERQIAIRRMPPAAPKSTDETFDWVAFRRDATNPLTYFFFFAYFFAAMPAASGTTFIPTVIRGLGYTSSVQINLLSIPFNWFAFLGAIINGLHSDFTRERYWHIVFPLSIATFSSLITGIGSLRPNDIPTVVRFLFATFTAAEAWSFPVIWAYRANSVAGSTSSALGSAVVLLGNALAYFVGPFLFPSWDAPNYTPGLWTWFASNCMALIMITAVSFEIRRQKLEVEKPLGVLWRTAPSAPPSKV